MKIEVISHTCSTIFWHIDRIFEVLRHALRENQRVPTHIIDREILKIADEIA